MKYPLPIETLAQGTAFVGKTGTGKTTSAKGGIEEVLRVEPGARVCILDPIKSDWWGLTSSSSGKRPGFAFQILGGPHGHVPLHPSSGKVLGELVGRGDLPLSIIDMANFPMGGLQHFFSNFAESLMRSMRGVLYLVLEEAHEFAPKERSGVGNENMAVYWAKKLATAGRTRGIRLMVVTQRTQKLHNDLLGSCETLVAHKLKAPADQKPVKDWLKDNCDPATFEIVSGSLGKLRRGTAWVCSVEAVADKPTEFPPLKTFDNTKTPESSDGEHHVTTAPVDRAKLAAILGDAVAESIANEPAKLKAIIRELEGKLAKQPAPAAAAPDTKALEAARADGYLAGARAGLSSKKGRFELIGGKVTQAAELLVAAGVELDAAIKDAAQGATELKVNKLHFAGPLAVVPGNRVTPYAPAPTAAPRRDVTVADGLSGPQQKILDALAWLEAVGGTVADRVRLAFLCDVSPKSSGFENNIGRLNKLELVRYPGPGKAELTVEGRSVANKPEAMPTNAALHSSIRAKLPPPQWANLEVLIREYPNAVTRDDIAERCNVSAKSSGFENNMGALRSLGLIEYPAKGEAVALPVLFVE